MLFAYPYFFILSLNSDIDWGVGEGDFQRKGDLRKNSKEFALASESKVWYNRDHLCVTDPMLTAFVTVFSTPPPADTCAPTFQRLSARFGNELSAETSTSASGLLLISFWAGICQWNILWTVIALLGDESSDSILLDPFWRRLRTSIFTDLHSLKNLNYHMIVHTTNMFVRNCTSLVQMHWLFEQ